MGLLFPLNSATLMCAALYLSQSHRSYIPTLLKSVAFFAVCIFLFSQFRPSITFAGREKILGLISGRLRDNELAWFFSGWILTKSKYSPTFCRQCLLSWEENGKLLFTALWKKEIIAKKMKFHIPYLESNSLCSHILTDAEITAAYGLTQKSYSMLKLQLHIIL